MSLKVDTGFIKKIKKYGAFDISACFNCGNCTAVCSLSKEDASFPRKMIRLAQIGAEAEISSSLEPWLCTYCGECSTTCPRQAYPGEFMMSLRRFLISKYDVTKISSFFYKFPFIQNILALLVFIVSLGAFISYHGDFAVLSQKIEVIFPFYISLALLSYIFIMYKRVIFDKYKKVLVSFKMKTILPTITQILKQIMFAGCTELDLWRGMAHVLVMSGYLLTLVISVFHILEPLTIHYNWLSLQSFLVFYSTGAIVLGGLSMMARRTIKKSPSSMFSHSSDWLFVLTIFLIGFSLLITHLANIVMGPQAHGVEMLYKINVAIEVAWILIIVPFTKWIHLFFRPIAIYLQHLKEERDLV